MSTLKRTCPAPLGLSTTWGNSAGRHRAQITDSGEHSREGFSRLRARRVCGSYLHGTLEAKAQTLPTGPPRLDDAASGRHRALTPPQQSLLAQASFFKWPLQVFGFISQLLSAVLELKVQDTLGCPCDLSWSPHPLPASLQLSLPTSPAWAAVEGSQPHGAQWPVLFQETRSISEVRMQSPRSFPLQFQNQRVLGRRPRHTHHST